MRLIIYDCENCYHENLAKKLSKMQKYEIVFVVGKRQNIKIKESETVTILKSDKIAHNHADFIAVTELSRRLHTKKYQSACIISNDKGFDGAIKLMREYGFSVNRYGPEMFERRYKCALDKVDINTPGTYKLTKTPQYRPSRHLKKYNIKKPDNKEKIVASATHFINRIYKETNKSLEIEETQITKMIYESSHKNPKEVEALLRRSHILNNKRIVLTEISIDNFCKEADKILSAT